MNRPTEAQSAILRFVADWWRERGYAPTVREIGTEFGWDSPAAAAFSHLRRMRAKGLIRWEPHTSRTLRLTAAGRRTLKGQQP